MGKIIVRDAAGILVVVGVGDQSPVGEQVGGAVIDRFGPGVGDLVGESSGESAIPHHLKRVVIRFADAPVIIGGSYVGVRRSRLRSTGTRCQSGVVVATNIEAPAPRTDIIHSERGTIGELVLDANVVLHRVGVLHVRVKEERHLAERVGRGQVPAWEDILHGRGGQRAARGSGSIQVTGPL